MKSVNHLDLHQSKYPKLEPGKDMRANKTKPRAPIALIQALFGAEREFSGFGFVRSREHGSMDNSGSFLTNQARRCRCPPFFLARAGGSGAVAGMPVAAAASFFFAYRNCA
jgi:hypothetical protein